MASGNERSAWQIYVRVLEIAAFATGGIAGAWQAGIALPGGERDGFTFGVGNTADMTQAKEGEVAAEEVFCSKLQNCLLSPAGPKILGKRHVRFRKKAD